MVVVVVVLAKSFFGNEGRRAGVQPIEYIGRLVKVWWVSVSKYVRNNIVLLRTLFANPPPPPKLIFCIPPRTPHTNRR